LYLAEKKPSTTSTEPVAIAAGVREEDVDLALAVKDGKIMRSRDPQL
jgi:hypothetical protein